MKKTLFLLAIMMLIISMLSGLYMFFAGWGSIVQADIAFTISIICWIVFEFISLYALLYYFINKKSSATISLLFFIHILYIAWFFFGDKIKYSISSTSNFLGFFFIIPEMIVYSFRNVDYFYDYRFILLTILFIPNLILSLFLIIKKILKSFPKNS